MDLHCPFSDLTTHVVISADDQHKRAFFTSPLQQQRRPIHRSKLSLSDQLRSEERNLKSQDSFILNLVSRSSFERSNETNSRKSSKKSSKKSSDRNEMSDGSYGRIVSTAPHNNNIVKSSTRHKEALLSKLPSKKRCSSQRHKSNESSQNHKRTDEERPNVGAKQQLNNPIRRYNQLGNRMDCASNNQPSITTHQLNFIPTVTSSSGRVARSSSASHRTEKSKIIKLHQKNDRRSLNVVETYSSDIQHGQYRRYDQLKNDICHSKNVISSSRLIDSSTPYRASMVRTRSLMNSISRTSTDLQETGRNGRQIERNNVRDRIGDDDDDVVTDDLSFFALVQEGRSHNSPSNIRQSSTVTQGASYKNDRSGNYHQGGSYDRGGRYDPGRSCKHPTLVSVEPLDSNFSADHKPPLPRRFIKKTNDDSRPHRSNSRPHKSNSRPPLVPPAQRSDSDESAPSRAPANQTDSIPQSQSSKSKSFQSSSCSVNYSGRAVGADCENNPNSTQSSMGSRISRIPAAAALNHSKSLTGISLLSNDLKLDNNNRINNRKSSSLNPKFSSPQFNLKMEHQNGSYNADLIKSSNWERSEGDTKSDGNLLPTPQNNARPNTSHSVSYSFIR